ncbi:MAG: divalent-cation tolerance protein CutA [Candidatus Woesearchaeota archaeon]|nr:divalent-cation tolerance protein CutA [Candidatus Woesearchaeota archaeon]
MRIAYVPTPDMTVAKQIARTLLDEQLITCANMHPVTSMYKEAEKLIDASEVILLLKTNNENIAAVAQRIEALHPYDTPCVLTFEATANDSYTRWMAEQLEHGTHKVE